MTREDAVKILEEMVENINLRKHMICVGACLKEYASILNEDQVLWEIAGLLHDADWEKYPDKHPEVIVSKLRSLGESELADAIASHGYGLGGTENRFTVKPKTKLDLYLRACDEISGFVIACSLVRPDKLDTLEVSSVKKKLKNKAFAAKVDRDFIYLSVREAGLDLDKHIQVVIDVLRGIKTEIFG